jgi:hypothetical protein
MSPHATSAPLTQLRSASWGLVIPTNLPPMQPPTIPANLPPMQPPGMPMMSAAAMASAMSAMTGGGMMGGHSMSTVVPIQVSAVAHGLPGMQSAGERHRPPRPTGKHAAPN